MTVIEIAIVAIKATDEIENITIPEMVEIGKDGVLGTVVVIEMIIEEEKMITAEYAVIQEMVAVAVGEIEELIPIPNSTIEGMQVDVAMTITEDKGMKLTINDAV